MHGVNFNLQYSLVHKHSALYYKLMPIVACLEKWEAQLAFDSFILNKLQYQNYCSYFWFTK